jgi:hypothetical protein
MQKIIKKYTQSLISLIKYPIEFSPGWVKGFATFLIYLKFIDLHFSFIIIKIIIIILIIIISLFKEGFTLRTYNSNHIYLISNVAFWNRKQQQQQHDMHR